jgi:hypothetical protein
MKKMIELDTTYCHHLNKPDNYYVLKAYADDKDKSTEKFINFFLWLVKTLRPTKAWNKPKTNQMIHEVKGKLEATIAKAKNGTSSSFRVAGDLIRTVKYTAKLSVYQGKGYPKYNPGVPEDLDTFIAQLESMSVAAA